METNQNLNLRSFFPIEGLDIQEVLEEENRIIIKLKSKTTDCLCPKCKNVTSHCHGTYKRKV